MAQKVRKTSKRTYTNNSSLVVFGKVLKGLVLFILLVSLMAALFLSSRIITTARNAPQVDIAKFLTLRSQSSLVDDEGEVMDRVITNEVRLPVKLAEISQNLQEAFIATEDERFFEHHGVDYHRTIGVTLRYAFSKLVGGDYSQGGSTLTQQLVKNTFLTTEKTESRKIQEMYMALQIEKKVSKESILETYLNSIFLGGRAYGVEAAARQYFSKSAAELSVIEAAYLAGVTTAPSYYYAFSEANQKNPTLLKNRTKTVLDQMHRNGYLTDAELKKYRDDINRNGIAFNYTTLVNGGRYNYEYFTRPVISAVVEDLVEKLGITREQAQENLAIGGYTIYTTMNRSFQENTAAQLNDPKNHTFREYVDKEGIVQPQVSAVITEQATGYVKALVGGRGEQVVAGPNRAASPNFLRAIGSATKPLTVYAAGIDTKLFDSATVFEDSPLSLEQRQDYFAGDDSVNPADPTKPGNSYGRWYGYTNVRDALGRSSNLVAIKAMLQVGQPTAATYAEKFGLVLPPENYWGTSMFSLGQFANIDGKDGANPLIMAGAFGTFANNGVRNKSILYTKVVDSAGRVILENKPEGEQIIMPGTAYILWDLLKSVVDRSTNISQAKIGAMPVGGKTGTTQDNKELWFAGATPYYSAAVIIASDDHQSILDKNGEYLGSALSAPKIWGAIMGLPHKDKAVLELPIPNDIVKVAVSYDSGTLPTELTRRDPRGDRTVQEWFFKDRVPQTLDDVHVEAEVNWLTGKLATDLTPGILKQKRVFITRDYQPEVKLEDQKYVLPKEPDQGPATEGYTVPAVLPSTKPPVTTPPVNPPPATIPATTIPAATTPPATIPAATTPPATIPAATTPPA